MSARVSTPSVHRHAEHIQISALRLVRATHQAASESPFLQPERLRQRPHQQHSSIRHLLRHLVLHSDRGRAQDVVRRASGHTWRPFASVYGHELN